jgi:hypothetical protein
MRSIVPMIVAVVFVGCGGADSVSAPSAVSAPPPSVSSAAPAPAPSPEPVAPLPRLQPILTAVSPNVVSTAGTWGRVTGAEFQPGATMTIGGVRIAAYSEGPTTIAFSSSGPHAPGTVDVIVTNPGGLSATLRRGYTYAAPESFDPNGEWIGHADAHNDYLTDMRFTIRGNQLVTVSCGTPVTMPVTVSVEGGKFSFAGEDFLAMTGSLTATTAAVGQVMAPGCGDGLWWAEKASSASALSTGANPFIQSGR